MGLYIIMLHISIATNDIHSHSLHLHGADTGVLAVKDCLAISKSKINYKSVEIFIQ